ncbi:hypothetical protein CVT26_000793 [Gymnopilus dilepis]|uniref:RlpA-like protein double-psi beta-barrel domain-containing protein n=1 Tax=Gymnopilus dilepis TaxID=231916 RepID=A0A409VHX6_9AGAR|nr:hypothetical protein CVT26_000793 [Gymnopilus dilepis]
MHPSILAILSSTLAVLFGVTGAAPPHARSVRQHHAARTNPDDTSVAVNVTSRALEKRFDEARFTFYAVGLGACGKTNAPGDFVSSLCISSILLVVLPDPTQVVALNSAQFAGGSHCFETITISVNGKSTSAQIVDECPGCPFAGLDFSSGLFQYFAPESVGVLSGSWNFGAGAAPSPSPSPKPTTHAPPPPPPSTTATPTHTTTSHSATHSTTSSSISTTSQSSTSSSAVASSASASPSAGNIQQLFLAHIQISTIPLALLALNGTTGSGSS